MEKANKILNIFKQKKGYGSMICAWSDEDVIEIIKTVLEDTYNIDELFFEIAKTTPYTFEDCTKFVILTGIDIDKVKDTLQSLSSYGVSNLNDVFIMIRLGYCNF